MEVNHSGFWDIAYRDNAPALLGVLRRYVKELSIAQDLLHEVFVTAIEKFDSYTGKGNFEGWLYRIAVNTALMYLRNERNHPVETWHAASLLSVTDDNDNFDDRVDDARSTIESAGFTSEELLSAIDRLPEHHKLVFNMYVMDDFSHKQISAELNISPGTSKSHLARARKKIQQFLYDDALNRKKKKDKRWASAFLLLFPAKKHYIDRLFYEGLSDYTISPTMDLKIQGFKDLKIEYLNHGSQFWGSKLSYLAACCGTAAVTGGICWLSMSDSSPLKYDRMDNRIVDTVMFSPNTKHGRDVARRVSIDAEAHNDNGDAAHHVSTDSAEHNDTGDAARHVSTDAPVVVKKQIIQRQTVVVRDTIFIIE